MSPTLCFSNKVLISFHYFPLIFFSFFFCICKVLHLLYCAIYLINNCTFEGISKISVLFLFFFVHLPSFLLSSVTSFRVFIIIYRVLYVIFLFAFPCLPIFLAAFSLFTPSRNFPLFSRPLKPTRFATSIFLLFVPIHSHFAPVFSIPPFIRSVFFRSIESFLFVSLFIFFPFFNIRFFFLSFFPPLSLSKYGSIDRFLNLFLFRIFFLSVSYRPSFMA
ncbi:unnamed protein product [Acanthosepion pharaonis]|uniref:Uncharacterized protein n=1 Tax=Acanthosepion pharaonis TaxID=158019 RepID=A0A812C9B4_ACAPH|nr:unnamed protein product [Sepia pharaonis]